MSNIKKVLFGITLLGFTLLLTAVFVMQVDIEEKTGVIQVKPPPVAQAHISLPADQRPDSFVAILIMPKSYLPLLEGFSHQRIGGKIEILPATFEINGGKIVATSKDTIESKSKRAIKQAHTYGEQDSINTESPAQKNTIIQKAAFLLLLAEAEKRARYK